MLAGLIAAVVLVGAAQRPAPDAPPPVAFVHVRVLPMDAQRTLDDQTVVTRGEEIVAIGAASAVAVPDGATVIDGAGRLFLMPGLADLHVHATSPDDLLLYVANGVTTVLNLGNAPTTFVTKTRARVRAGELLGPTCHVAPLLNGPRGGDLPSDTPEHARGTVRRAKEIGYEFIKVYNELSRPTFLAICEEARAQGLTVVGHGVRSVGLEESFAAGQAALVHGEEYFYTELGGTNELRVPRAIELTKEQGAWVIPNLSAYETIAAQWGRPEVVRDDFLARPEAKLLRPFWRKKWQGGRYDDGKPGGLDERVQILRRMTKGLHDADVPLLLGTDSPDIPGVEAGYSAHLELALLVASGLTPFDALVCGTRAAGEFLETALPEERPIGTVELGKRADLVLLAADPFADVANARAIEGVMVRGRWHPKAELAARLHSLEELQAARAVTQARLEARAKESDDATATREYLAARAADPKWVELDEEDVNELGYEALRLRKDAAGARAWFLVNTTLHPESANSWDSLAEAQLALGEQEAAAASYRRALELDRWNENARQVLARIAARAGG